MQNTHVAEAAAQHVVNALSAMREGQFDIARESFYKGWTLFEYVSGVGSTVSTHLEVSKAHVLEIIDRLSQSITTPTSSTQAFHSRISDDDVPNLQDDSADEFDINEETSFGGDFSDVVGCCQAKRSLAENVILPFSCPPSGMQLFQGIRSGTGNVLLHGPPGTGKTMLAQATAREARAVFYCVHPSDVLSKYQGESERYLKEVFRRARNQPRAIIFFDEFDSLAAARGSGDDTSAQSRRLLSELLVQMTLNKQVQQQQRKRLSAASVSQSAALAVVTPVRTSLGVYLDQEAPHSDTQDMASHHQHQAPSSNNDCAGQQGKVVVLAATNRLEDLDEAVLRRFETKVYVGLPELPVRLEMLQRHLQGIECHLSEQDLLAVGEMTASWSGSDIEILCREAAMAPVREVLPYDLLLSGASASRTATVTTDATGAAVSPVSAPVIGTKRKAAAIEPGAIEYSSTKEEGDAATSSGFNWEQLQHIQVRAVELRDFVSAHENLLRTGENITQTL